MVIGLIIDKNTKRPIRDAYIHVYGIDKNITSTGTCLFWASGEHKSKVNYLFFFYRKRRILASVESWQIHNPVFRRRVMQIGLRLVNNMQLFIFVIICMTGCLLKPLSVHAKCFASRICI